MWMDERESDASMEIVAGLRALGERHVVNIPVVCGFFPERNTQLIPEVTFDFSNLDPKDIFWPCILAPVINKYRQRYWYPKRDDAVRRGEPLPRYDVAERLVADMPRRVSVWELFASRSKAFTTEKVRQAVLIQAAKTAYKLALKGVDKDIIRETVQSQEVTWTEVQEYLQRHSEHVDR